jgi:glycine dehydrogenase subunit 1
MSRFSQKGEGELRRMLATIGVEGIENLFQSIPPDLILHELLDLPPAHSEDQLLRTLGTMAARNAHADNHASFLGAGMYDHFVPSVVRSIAGRSEFATAYTPYQAEASQGTLQVIFEFQTLMCELLAMDVANASLYDAGSAVAEAINLAVGAKRRRRALVAPGVHPYYREVARTYSAAGNAEIVVLPSTDGVTPAAALAEHLDDTVACVVVQHPNYLGLLEEAEALGEATHRAGALFIAVVDPISLGVLKPPGEYGADLAVGEGQSLGLFQSFGGPGFGFFAGRKDQLRRLPGRLVGETVDQRGRRGFVLTLQTREQHIRRERATSNICTNQGLMATAATIYMALLGPRGIHEMATQSMQRAHYAADALAAAGAPRLHTAPFFREFAVRPPGDTSSFVEQALAAGILAGVPLRRLDPEQEDGLLVAVTERRTKAEIDRLASVARRVTDETGTLQNA